MGQDRCNTLMSDSVNPDVGEWEALCAEFSPTKGYREAYTTVTTP